MAARLRVDSPYYGLRHLRKLRLISKLEMRKIIGCRIGLEHKVNSRSVVEILLHIQYEINLMLKIKDKKKKINVCVNIPEYYIARRIDFIFKRGLHSFAHEVKLWLMYIEFCKSVNLYTSLSYMLLRMMEVHRIPRLWVLAACIEFQHANSVDKARKYLYDGLTLFPDSKLLYQEAFRLELTHFERMLEKNELQESREIPLLADKPLLLKQEPSETETKPSCSTISDCEQVLESNFAEMIFDLAVKNVDDVSFVLSLLDIAKKYSFTEILQKKIINYILAQYPHSELTWDAAARHVLQGLPCKGAIHARECTSPDMAGLPENIKIKVEDEGKECSAAVKVDDGYKNRIRQCCAVYTDAVRRLQTPQMWSLYLYAMTELSSEEGPLLAFRKKMLQTAYHHAHRAKMMDEEQYLKWIDFLNCEEKYDRLAVVLPEATKHIPTSSKLWQMQLRFFFAHKNEIQALTAFSNALKHLGNEEPAFPLWKILLQYYQTKNRSTVEDIFETALSQGGYIAAAIKPLYLEWLMLVKGDSEAREIYKSLAILRPFCIDTHTKMISLESTLPVLDVDYIRQCYEISCEQYGKNNIDVWLNYIKFEKEHGKEENLNTITWRALKSLDRKLTATFSLELSFILPPKN